MDRNKVAIFNEGVLISIISRGKAISLDDNCQIAYDNDSMIITEHGWYDPDMPWSIINLIVPVFRRSESVTRDLSYILRIRCNCFDDPTVLPLFVNKTLAMMEASPIEWLRVDYLRVLANYYRLGLFDAGDFREAEYRHQSPQIFANNADQQHEAEHLSTKYYFEDKYRRYEEHRQLRERFPELTPASATVYSRNRTMNTKGFNQLKIAAKESGFQFEPLKPYHYCRILNQPVSISYTREGKRIMRVECSKRVEGKCHARDRYGNWCIYPPLE